MLFAHSLSRIEGCDHIQASFPEVVQLLLNLGNVDLDLFTPLTWVRSAEVACQACRQIVAHHSDDPYPGVRVPVLNNNPGRWRSGMDQLFRLWAALYLVTPEVLAELIALTVRTESILRALQH